MCQGSFCALQVWNKQIEVPDLRGTFILINKMIDHKQIKYILYQSSKCWVKKKKKNQQNKMGNESGNGDDILDTVFKEILMEKENM